MDTIKNWYAGLGDGTKAALRTFLQTFLASLGVLALAAISEANDVLGGQSVDEALADLSVAAKAFASAVLGAVAALIAGFMNRGDKGATYPS